MGALIDRLFSSTYYEAVCHDYSDAKTRYRKGFKHFLKKEKTDDQDTYSFKEHVHRNIELIKEMDAVVCKYEELLGSFPQGVKEFEEQHRNVSPSYELYKKISGNSARIKRYDMVHREYDRLVKVNKAAVDLLAGTSPSFSLKERLADNIEEVESFIRKHDRYFALYGEYPLAIGAYAGDRPIAQQIEHLCSEVSATDLKTMETFLEARKANPDDMDQAVKEIGVDLIAGDFSQRNITGVERALERYNEIVRVRQINRQYEELAAGYPKAIAFLFARDADALSFDERCMALQKKESLLRLYRDYCKMDPETFPETVIDQDWNQNEYGYFLDIFPRMHYVPEDHSCQIPDDCTLKKSIDLLKYLETSSNLHYIPVEYIEENLSSIKEYHRLNDGSYAWYVDDIKRIVGRDEVFLDAIRKIRENQRVVETVMDMRNRYKYGYPRFVSKNSIPDISRATVDQLQFIIDHRGEIEQLNAVCTASELIRRYRDAAERKFGRLPSLDPDSCSDMTLVRNIVRSESELRTIQAQIDEKKAVISRLKRSVCDWNEDYGFPHYFFYWYYPKRFESVSDESMYARSLIYDFKDGRSSYRITEMMKVKLKETFSSSDLKILTFVCIPASTVTVNEKRYRSFSDEICSATGMRNGFDHIRITKEKTASHLGGTDSAEYSIERQFFSGSHIVLFDDVVTSGSSVRQFSYWLESIGADVVCAISIGRTYSDYYGDVQRPHPYSGKR